MNNNIVLYSTNCPRCIVLTNKMKEKNIKYQEINDIEVMQKKGYLSVPILEVDGVSMNFKEAVDWVNSLDNN